MFSFIFTFLAISNQVINKICICEGTCPSDKCKNAEQIITSSSTNLDDEFNNIKTETEENDISVKKFFTQMMDMPENSDDNEKTEVSEKSDDSENSEDLVKLFEREKSDDIENIDDRVKSEVSVNS